jgi:hypothetical protein
MKYKFVSPNHSDHIQLVEPLHSSVSAFMDLLTPMLNHFSLLNWAVSRDAALTSVSIDNEEFHFICIPI